LAGLTRPSEPIVMVVVAVPPPPPVVPPPPPEPPLLPLGDVGLLLPPQAAAVSASPRRPIEGRRRMAGLLVPV